MTCLGSCLDLVIVKFVLVRSSLKSQLTSNLWASLALVYSKGKDIIFSHLTMKGLKLSWQGNLQQPL